MKRFHFNLQALLTVRQRAEQMALEKYASALLARGQALEKLGAIHREQSAWWTRWRSQINEGCSAGALSQWQACDRRLTEKRQQTEEAVTQAEVAVNQALHAMLLARREREAVEKHLEKQRANHRRELGREEQKVLDELAQRRVLPTLGSSRVPHLVAS